jgi:hypothetical protein
MLFTPAKSGLEFLCSNNSATDKALYLSEFFLYSEIEAVLIFPSESCTYSSPLVPTATSPKPPEALASS